MSTAVFLRQLSLQRIDALFAEPQTADSARLDQVSAELTLWQILYRAAQGLTTPAELQAFHVQHLGALELLDGAAVDIFDAFEAGDQDRLTEASAKTDEAIRIILNPEAEDEG